jgi:hypothetical protein
MPIRRPRTSLTLVGAALALLVSIAIGQRVGDRVLSAGTDRRPTVVRPLATPVPEPSERAVHDWKREQIVVAATDPGFPDPRATRTPPPAPPSPVPTHTPRPSPSPSLTPESTPLPFAESPTPGADASSPAASPSP